jgi:GNAT superfamily N-acetyltransferase
MLPIRRLDPSDAPAFRTLRLRALREHPQAFTSSYEEDAALPLAATEQGLAGGDRCSWGGFDAGTLCAMAGLERESRAKARHKATLVGMYVAPEYADRGIGRELVETLIAAARDLGLE